jgi:hypothetical protein
MAGPGNESSTGRKAGNVHVSTNDTDLLAVPSLLLTG